MARQDHRPAALQGSGTETGPLLEVRSLCVVVRAGEPHPVLDRVSLHVAPREVLAIVGESGCGKTMTCLTVLGLQPRGVEVTGGLVRFAGADLLGASDRVLESFRGRRIAMIFQDPSSALNPVHRIGGTLVRSIARHRGLSQADAASEARRLLERVGIPRPQTRMNAYPHELSGGMNQRVMIALALAGEPELLIADEPTSALDVTTQKQILDLLGEIQSDTGMAMILISHDLGVVAQIAHRVAVMYCGRVVEEATVRDLFAAPAHPYTAGLIASMPPDPQGTADAHVRPIRGMVAPLSDLPSGCHFHTRCDRVIDRCREGVPSRMTLPGTERSALCQLPLL